MRMKLLKGVVVGLTIIFAAMGFVFFWLAVTGMMDVWAGG